MLVMFRSGAHSTTVNAEGEKILDQLHVTVRAGYTTHHIYFHRRFGGKLTIERITYFKDSELINLLDEVKSWTWLALEYIASPVRPTNTAYTTHLVTVMSKSILIVSSTNEHLIETFHILPIKLLVHPQEDGGSMSLRVRFPYQRSFSADSDVATHSTVLSLAPLNHDSVVFPAFMFSQTAAFVASDL
jgi:hypothetical protein